MYCMDECLVIASSSPITIILKMQIHSCMWFANAAFCFGS